MEKSGIKQIRGLILKFDDEYFSREHRYAIGTQRPDGKRFFSIPVSNQVCDYEEFYEISEDEFSVFLRDPVQARAFAEACRRRENDERLFLKPGSDRGI